MGRVGGQRRGKPLPLMTCLKERHQGTSVIRGIGSSLETSANTIQGLGAYLPLDGRARQGEFGSKPSMPRKRKMQTRERRQPDDVVGGSSYVTTTRTPIGVTPCEGEANLDADPIIQRHKLSPHVEYLVKWKGRPESETRWETTRE